MKKQLYFAISLAFFILFAASCTGIKTTAKGLENEAFIEFVGNPKNYKNGLEVNIDDKINFKAEVNKSNAKNPNKGKVYAISTGKHIITVSYENSVLYQKQIFISAQETKSIVLP